jgi:hypothetical protein
MLLAARLKKKRVPGYSGGTNRPQPGEETEVDQRAGAEKSDYFFHMEAENDDQRQK